MLERDALNNRVAKYKAIMENYKYAEQKETIVGVNGTHINTISDKLSKFEEQLSEISDERLLEIFSTLVGTLNLLESYIHLFESAQTCKLDL